MRPSPPNSNRDRGSFVITRSWSGYYVWKLEDAHGRVIETSATRYDSYEACQAAVERLRRLAATATIARPPRAARVARTQTGT